MIIFIYGGSGSGKSAFAENICFKINEGKKYYIATMINSDEETNLKVIKHRNMRKNKNFITIECPFDLKNVILDTKSTVIIECLSNLTANEIFLRNNKNACDDILLGIKNIAAQSENVVIVSNNIFEGGKKYSSETLNYMKILGDINYYIAKMSDESIHIISSIPVYYKQKEDHNA